MDLYRAAVDCLAQLEPVRDWPEAGALLRRAGEKRDRNWRLPALACQAVGGQPEQAVPAMAAIAAHQIAIILVDDMLDADPRGWHQAHGMPLAANLALAFQSAGNLAGQSLALDPLPRLQVLHRLSAMALTVAQGQALDVQAPANEPAYWRLIGLKSGPFFGAALELGAWCGGANGAQAAGLYQLGHLIGEMIQLHDDVNDTLATPANPDWLAGRLPLPILFAQTVPHPDRERFTALRLRVSEPPALHAAQELLIRCGAISYCVFQLQEREQLARQQLVDLALPQPDGLLALLDELIRPVNDLLVNLTP